MATLEVLDAYLEQLHGMEECGLHSSAKILSEFLMCMCKGSNEFILQRLDATVSFANALFHTDEIQRAQAYFKEALQLCESIIASVPAFQAPAHLSPSALRFSIAKCLTKLNMNKEALVFMQRIPLADRTPGMSHLLARLEMQCGTQRTANMHYRELLKTFPLAIDALEAVLKTGGSRQDICAILKQLPGVSLDSLEWVLRWLDAQSNAARHELPKAVSDLVSLESDFCHGSPLVLSMIANYQWKQGYLPAALAAYEKSTRADPLNMDLMDIYAHVLVAQGSESKLNALCNSLMKISKARVEPWIAMARYSQLMCENANNEAAARYHARKGLSFINKASEIEPNYSEMLMVKGTLLLAVDKASEAAPCFRKAYMDKSDFVAYQGLVSCYLATNRVKDALLIATEAQKNMPRNPRALTLMGVVCMRCQDGNANARRAFENALTLNPNCMDAVFALTELEIEERKFQAAITLLRKHLQHTRMDYMYRRLGDVYMLMDAPADALKLYNSALSVNKDYEPAKDGVERATAKLNGSVENEDEEEEGLEDESGMQQNMSGEEFTP